MALPPSELMPRRLPSLIERVWQVIARSNPALGPQEEERDSSQSGQVVDATSRLVGQQFNLSYARPDIYADADDMDRLSEEVSVALDTIADNVCTSEDGVQMSFQTTSKDTAVQKVLDEVNSSCDLHQKVRPLVRNLVKYGDMFGEIVVNNDLKVVDLKQLPPKTMHRNQDTRGNLILGEPRYNGENVCQNEREECAFDQRDPEDDDRVVAAFYPWQIAHARLNWDGFSAYGRGHVRVTRHSWKRIRAIEEAMIIARLTRAYLKLVHYIDATGMTPLEKQKVVRAYKQAAGTRGRMDNKRDAPYQVMTDFFLTNGYVRFNGQPLQQLSKIDVIDPRNDDLHHIGDIEYLHRKLISTLRVPPAHMGFERDLNAKATLTQQDVQYVRWLRSVQQLVGQLLEQVYDTALALSGIDPLKAEYRVTWPMLKATDELAAAQAESLRATADAVYLGKGPQSTVPVIDARWVQENRLDMTAEDIEELEQRLAEQKQIEDQEAQQQQAQAHQNQLELLKAKPAPGGAQNGKPAAGKLRPVSNEARSLTELLQESLLIAQSHEE